MQPPSGFRIFGEQQMQNNLLYALLSLDAYNEREGTGFL